MLKETEFFQWQLFISSCDYMYFKRITKKKTVNVKGLEIWWAKGNGKAPNIGWGELINESYFTVLQMKVQSLHLATHLCFIHAVVHLCPYLMAFAVHTGQGRF